MAFALLGADVTATDIPAVLPILKKNIKRNFSRISDAYTARFGAPGKVRPAQLCWGNSAQIAAVARSPFDFVVIADVVYLEEHVLLLLETAHAVTSDASVVLLGYRMRQEEAHAKFWGEIGGFFEVKRVGEEMGEELLGVELYLLRKKRRY